MVSMDEIDYWDAEATQDPRYSTASWGMTSTIDDEGTIDSIIAILERGLPHRFGRVLEIGCGPCRLLLRMAERHSDAAFYGRDISAEMLWIANRRIAESGADNIHVSMIEGMYRGMDLVYCVELMQHLDDEAASAVIAEALAALRPGGVFIAQFVVRGEPGPHSFPRPLGEAFELYGEAWDTRTASAAVHPDWFWVQAVKR